MTFKADASIPFAYPVYVRRILDCLNSRGIPLSTVLASAGLAWQEIGDGQRMLDFAVFRRFVAHALRCSGEPALGVLAGLMLQPYHTPVGIAAVTSETLGQGLEAWSRHARLIFGSAEFQLDNGPTWSTLKVIPTRPMCETQVFVMHSILGAHLRLLEAILERPVDELVVGLPYERPVDHDVPCSRYVRRVEFGQGSLTLQLPVGLLRLPCPCANLKAFVAATQACERTDAELDHGAFVHRVRRALLERLMSNPDTSDLALDLGVSARVLVRRLAEAGITYSDIKEDLRRSQATWYLEHTDLPIEVIASQLGYGDPSNFSRKFRHWYSIPPSTMRQTLRMR